MSRERDYYSILQVNPAASQEEIEAAYRRLSRAYDPATSKKAKASERMRDIEEAYGVLADRKRRAEYDNLRARGVVRLSGDMLPPQQGFGQWFLWASLAVTAVGVIIIMIVFAVIKGDEGAVTIASNPTTPPAASGSPAASGAPDTPPAVSGSEVIKPSGLKYIEVKIGAGDAISPGQTAVVHYTGWLANGAKFDSSLDRGEPFEFKLGAGQVIKGWDEGVAGMQVGSKRRLTVPSELAYGVEGRPPAIPPNSTLTFDVELLGIK